MIQKKDVVVSQLDSWDKYVNKEVKDVLAGVYAHAEESSKRAREWYWNSIRSKRIASRWVRMSSFALVVCGIVTPLLAGNVQDDHYKFELAQLAVAALALAGLLQAADRIFGWSSGWIRYIATATAMEMATSQFELDWSNYIIGKSGSLGEEDKRPLFELAKQLTAYIAKQQSDETDKWSAEFSSGMVLLNDLIKSQRDLAEKAAQAAQSAVASQAGAQKPGGIEVSILQEKGAAPVKISLDQNSEVMFTGTSWSKLGISPGQHLIEITPVAVLAQAIQKIVDVPSGGVARLEVRLC